MNSFLILKRLLCFALLSIFITSCSETTADTDSINPAQSDIGNVELTVYKTESCGCCGMWVDHVEASGFSTVVINTEDLSSIKISNGIIPGYASCHTAVSRDGYVFEGHIPANTIKRFLSEKPDDAVGLSVPGMPIGSPGMEMGNKTVDYEIYALKRDGTVEVYEEVNAAHF